MTFTGTQISAIFSVAGAMCAADGRVDEIETLPLTLFAAIFGMQVEDVERKLEIAGKMEPPTALNIIANFSYEQKKHVKALLTAIMDADGKRHPEELKLLAMVTIVCGLPQ